MIKNFRSRLFSTHSVVFQRTYRVQHFAIHLVSRYTRQPLPTYFTYLSVMLELFIVMSLFMSGKTQVQLTNMPGAINVRIIPQLPLDRRTFVALEQDRLISITPQVVTRQNSVPAVRSTDQLETSDDNAASDLNYRPPTLREDRPDQRILIPKEVDRPHRPEKAKIKNNNIYRNINSPVNSEVEKMNLDRPSYAIRNGNTSADSEQNMAITVTNKTQTPVQDKPLFGNGSKVNGSAESNGASGKPQSPSVIDKVTGVEVTLDERASFDGDKCPTGYVRINDKCVEVDKDR